MMRIRSTRNSNSQLRIMSGARCPPAMRLSGIRLRLSLVVHPMLASLAILTSGVESRGQVVQLPTFRQFTVSTTVSVPDGGTSSLAGNGYLAESYVGSGIPLFGPLGASRVRTRTSHSQHAAVSASVTEFRNQDARVLAAAAREIMENEGGVASGGGSGGTTDDPPMVLRPAGSSTSGGMSGAGGLAATDPGHFSVVELKQQRREAEKRKQQEALAFYQRALSAESQGKPAVARSYYHNAFRRGDAKLKEQIAVRQSVLNRVPTFHHRDKRASEEF